MPATPERPTLLSDLRAAYDAAADEREERSGLQPWKAEERQRFLELVRAEGASTLLEVGAGTGLHGRWFADNGHSVVATDLSPVMAEHCRAKGLEAYEMDFLSLRFERPFDAAFGLNCLLHVPQSELRACLETIRDCLRPGGLAYLGQYGGIDRAGVWEGDHYTPKRFFSYLTDEAMTDEMASVFEVQDFRDIDIGEDPMHFQAFVLRRPA